MKICIIDDDAIYAEIVSRLVMHYGLSENPMLFKNGEEAFEYLSNSKGNADLLPDLVLLDLDMPVMDGWGFLEAYKSIKEQLPKNIAIYVWSSSVDPNDIRRAREYDYVADFLPKPLNEETLRRIIAA